MYWTTLSVILGGILAILGGILTGWLQHRHERRALMQAFVGEIGAVTAIIRRRNYLAQIDNMLERLKQGKQLAPMSITAKDLFLIYQTNAGKIGLLPQGQADDVARFYTFAISLIEDAGIKHPALTAGDGVERFLDELKAMVEELVELGDKIVAQWQADHEARPAIDRQRRKGRRRALRDPV